MIELPAWFWPTVVGALIGIPLSVAANVLTPAFVGGVRAIWRNGHSLRLALAAHRVAVLESWLEMPHRLVLEAIARGTIAISAGLAAVCTLLLSVTLAEAGSRHMSTGLVLVAANVVVHLSMVTSVLSMADIGRSLPDRILKARARWRGDRQEEFENEVQDSRRLLGLAYNSSYPG